MKLPKVCVIVVAWNRKDFVAGLLAQLLHINYNDYDIVVIDNASSDGTSEMIRSMYPQVILLRNSENLGGTGGFNTGLIYALEKGLYEYVWLLDDDVLVDADALHELVTVLENNRNIGIAGSAMFDIKNPERLIEMGNFIDIKHGKFSGNQRFAKLEGSEDKVYFVDSVSACSMCIPTRAILSVGIWDEYFFIYCDDVDWNMRFKRNGYLIAAVSKSKIWHMPWEFKSGFNTIYYANRNRLYLINKHLTGLKRLFGLVYAQLAIIYFSMVSAYKKQYFNSLIFLQSIIDFLQGKGGMFRNQMRFEALYSATANPPCSIWIAMTARIVLYNIGLLSGVIRGMLASIAIELVRVIFRRIPWKYRLAIIKKINNVSLKQNAQ